MKFLIDRCAGRLLADWLRKEGHDVVESRELTLGIERYLIGRPNRQEFSLRLTLILVS